MISYNEALLMVMEAAVPLPPEPVPLEMSLERVLYGDIYSDIDMPPFNKSAMDGYACRRDDLPGPLEVMGILPAGVAAHEAVQKGQCIKIMTGSQVPSETDCVIKVEDTLLLEDGKIMFTKDKTESNICFKAEDVTAGQKVLEAGTLIKPQHMAIMAAVGATKPMVFRQVSIGLIATGDELVEPWETPGPSRIRNSNATQLLAQCRQLNCRVKYYGIIQDDETQLARATDEALRSHDIVLLSGGVSMGDYDLVPGVLKKAGLEILFDKMAVQPGKPTVFGTKGRSCCFGLPGNPVSSFVQFELLVKPLVYKLSNHDFSPAWIPLPMAVTFKRKKADRQSFLPAIIENGKAKPLEYHGSAHIHAYVSADCILSVPIGITEIPENELADVRFL